MSIASQDKTSEAPATLIAVKAVPGAKRDEVVGRLGERLKVRISAPPEDGKANKAICELLARELGVRARDVEVVRGHSSAEKTLRVMGVQAIDIENKWPQ
ncbi:MAG: YggU family protein [Pyrinomonadaceae bacterium]|nr:YggU family protein [Phycisphaerales bacterium]